MIQRVQTLYLIFSILICVLTFIFFSEQLENKDFSVLDYKYYFLKYSFILIAFLNFTSILFYKKRVYQLYINKFALFIHLVLILSVFSFYLSEDPDYINHYKILIACIISFILILFSNRAINKDKKLVDSINRLR